VRVEDDDGPHLVLLLDLDLPRDRLDRGVERVRGERGGVPDLVAGVVVGGLDRRPGERVVELVEEEQLPRARQLVVRVRARAEPVRDRAPLLGALERVLRAAVPELDPGVGRVAAGRVVLELAPDRRVRPVRAVEPVEEAAQRAQLEPRLLPRFVQPRDLPWLPTP
jgi:hypothetical protein